MTKIFLKENWVGLACLCAVVALIAINLTFATRKKIAYADGQVLFEKFKMTIEAKKNGDYQVKELTNVIDSLSQSLDGDDRESNAAKISEIQRLRDSLDVFTYKFTKQQTRKILVRLQSYSKEYAENQSFEILIAPQQPENVLYASEGINVTEELLRYVNKRYEGL